MEGKRKKFSYLDMSDRNLRLLLDSAGKALSAIYNNKRYECRDMEGGGAGIRISVDTEAKENNEVKKLIVDFEKQQFTLE